jgi:hypothetical protein
VLERRREGSSAEDNQLGKNGSTSRTSAKFHEKVFETITSEVRGKNLMAGVPLLRQESTIESPLMYCAQPPAPAPAFAPQRTAVGGDQTKAEDINVFFQEAYLRYSVAFYESQTLESTRVVGRVDS